MSKKVSEENSLQTAFLEFVKDKGRRPKSVSEFCRGQEVDRESFRTHFSTLAALEKDLWKNWFYDTISVLENSPEYHEYSARERLLSFYYTWMETIKPAREYLKVAPVLPQLYSGVDWFLTDAEGEFLNYTKGLIQLAATNQEIVKRPLLQNYYNKALWQQFLFIMNYWIKDKSEEQAKTDEAIERAVNLFFELAGRTQADAIFDFGKFLFTGKR